MEKKPIARMRTNKQDVACMFSLFAGLQELEKAAQEMEKRFRLIPNGWRDVKCIISMYNRMMDNLIATVPVEKLNGLTRMLPRMRFKVYCGVQASEMGSDECIITLKEADVLCRYAHEQCKLCFEDNCSKCPLGKTLDSVMTYDRDGRSWSSVDLHVLAEQEKEEGGV